MISGIDIYNLEHCVHYLQKHFLLPQWGNIEKINK